VGLLSFSLGFVVVTTCKGACAHMSIHLITLNSRFLAVGFIISFLSRPFSRYP